MGPEEEPEMLVLLLGLAVALYAVTWLLAGPPGDRVRSPAALPVSAINVTLLAH